MKCLYALSLLSLISLLSLSCSDRRSPSAPDWPTPLFAQRADPHLILQDDGWYTFTATVPEYDRIELRRARSIAELPKTEAKVIWRKHATGRMGAHIWAPEIHHIDGKWYVYFAAGATENVFDIRIYVLENASADPLEGEWIERGQLNTGWESFSLDATTFTHRGKRYLCWAQHDPSIQGNTNLYLAPMDSPTSLGGKAVMLSMPELPWEIVRFRVNEAPAALERHGRVFISYSASGTGAEYCMGLLSAAADSDLLDAKSWTKSPEPVLKTDAARGVFGPGHNCFTPTADRKGDLLVFHARTYRDIQGEPLHDPNRHTRVVPLRWASDGTPDFRVSE